MLYKQADLIAKLNTQMALVSKLIKQLKLECIFISKSKKLTSHVLQAICIMEQNFSQLALFDDPDSQSDSLIEDVSMAYSQKNLLQITGASLFSKDKIDKLKSQNAQDQSSYISHQSHNKPSDGVRRTYRSYKLAQKLHVIELHKQGQSFAFISKLLKIPQKNIIRWCRDGVQRKEGGGRKIADFDMQMRIIEWMKQNYEHGSQICIKSIQQKASQFSSKPEFKCSNGWLKNFIRRYNLSQLYRLN